MRVLPLRVALLEVAAEHEQRAATLEEIALRRAAEGRVFAPPAPRVADLILEAQQERQRAEAARAVAAGLRF